MHMPSTNVQDVSFWMANSMSNRKYEIMPCFTNKCGLSGKQQLKRLSPVRTASHMGGTSRPHFSTSGTGPCQWPGKKKAAKDGLSVTNTALKTEQEITQNRKVCSGHDIYWFFSIFSFLFLCTFLRFHWFKNPSSLLDYKKILFQWVDSQYKDR